MTAWRSRDETIEAGALVAPSILADTLRRSVDSAELEVSTTHGAQARRFSVYAPMAAFDLVEELTHLSARSIDRNVFFAPQFLVPAMPRLDERRVRLLVLRDEARGRSRLRLLMPYSVEGAGPFGRLSMLRAWSHPFGPLGTLPIDGDDPAGTLKDFLATLADPDLSLAPHLVLPDLRIDGPMAQTLLTVAREAGLPVAVVNAFDRAALIADAGGEAVKGALSSRRRRELRRQWRRLSAFGAVSVEVAREPAAVRLALEDFLMLEASGWKGRQRSALTDDRYRAAFAREAVHGLAERGGVRIFTLRVGTRPAASLVTFIEGCEAFAWKTAYDEDFAFASPGQQVMAEATRVFLADPSIQRVDSCAAPDHFVMNRFWKDRVRIATVVVGLRPGREADVEAIGRLLARRRRRANLWRLARKRLRALLPL